MSGDLKGYYSDIGVSPSATADEIKAGMGLARTQLLECETRQPEVQTLTTTTTSTQMITKQLSFTLNPVPYGNIHPVGISPGYFNAD